MKILRSGSSIPPRLLTALLLAVALPAVSADLPALKGVFRDQFAVGTAVNRSMVTGTASFRRPTDLVEQDIALVTMLQPVRQQAT